MTFTKIQSKKIEMKKNYSVFLGNVGSCSDRYCATYGKSFSTEELFRRVATVPYLTGVDLVLTPELVNDWQTVRRMLDETGLMPISLAVDHFAQAKWKQGAFTSPNLEVRKSAVEDTKRAMDLAAEINCDLVTIWPGQDGYDYIFQANYEQERTWFADGIREACQYNKNIRIALEYKAKEPRNRCYLNNTAVTILILDEIGEANSGAVLDYGHVLLGYESPAEAVALLHKYGDRLFHVHINDNYRLWDDDLIVGSVHTLEYLEFLYWLRRTEYNGFMTIDQYPYREDGRDAVTESAEWLNILESLVADADLNGISEMLKRKDAIEASRFMRKLLFKGMTK